MPGGGDITIHDAFIGVASAVGWDKRPALVKGREEAADGAGTYGRVPSCSISFGQLLAVCTAFASHLEKDVGTRSTGPPRTDERGALIVGGTAAVMLDSSDELMVAYFASLIAGKCFAPIETSLPSYSVEGVLASLRASANLTHLIVDRDNTANSHASTSLSCSPPPLPIKTFAIALRHDDDGECGVGDRRWKLKVSELVVTVGTKPVKPLTLLGDASISISFTSCPTGRFRATPGGP